MGQIIKVMRRNSMKILVLPSLLLLLIFFIYPIITVLIKSFTEPEFGIENYVHFFQQSAYIKALLNTFKISLIVTVITVLAGYPVAYVMATSNSKVKNLIMLAVLLPFWTALLVRTFAWMVLLQDGGIINQTLISIGIINEPLPLINNLPGVVIGMVYVMLPFVILPMHATMASIDMGLLRAAKSLGARPFTAFVRVFLPLSLPGVGTGAIIVFVMTLGYYIIPALLGGTEQIMLGEFIADQIQSHLNWGIGATAGTVLVCITMIFFVIYLKISDADTGKE